VGRTAYISQSEMKQLLARLAQPPLQWDESTKIESFESYKTIELDRRMHVKILSINGTAKSSISPNDICATLSRLESALQTPRALWEFQLFQMGYQCHVATFNPDAYPDRVF
jgi:hypothetical protein